MEQFEIDAAIQSMNFLKSQADQLVVNQAVTIAQLSKRVRELEDAAVKPVESSKKKE